MLSDFIYFNMFETFTCFSCLFSSRPYYVFLLLSCVLEFFDCLNNFEFNVRRFRVCGRRGAGGVFTPRLAGNGGAPSSPRAGSYDRSLLLQCTMCVIIYWAIINSAAWLLHFGPYILDRHELRRLPIECRKNSNKHRLTTTANCFSHCILEFYKWFIATDSCIAHVSRYIERGSELTEQRLLKMLLLIIFWSESTDFYSGLGSTGHERPELSDQ